MKQTYVGKKHFFISLYNTIKKLQNTRKVNIF